MSALIRRDQAWLNDWVKKGLMEAKEANYLASLSYVEIPFTKPVPTEFTAFIETDKVRTRDAVKREDYRAPLSIQEFPLHECVFYQSDVQWYILLKIVDDVYNLTVWECQTDHQYYGDRFFMSFRIPVDGREPIEFLKRDHSDLEKFVKKGGWLVKPFEITKEDNEFEALIALQYFRRWCAFNHQNDRYAIAVNLADIGQRSVMFRRKNAASVKVYFGPRIEYMERLPVQPGKPVTEPPPKRKGYFVTLRSERFAKHFDYMKPKGHYRKPAWVGDMSVIVDGLLYTVIDTQTTYASEDD